MAVAFAESLKLWMKTFQNFAPIRKVILPGQPANQIPNEGGLWCEDLAKRKYLDLSIWSHSYFWTSKLLNSEKKIENNQCIVDKRIL